jgi:hypothetical protein
MGNGKNGNLIQAMISAGVLQGTPMNALNSDSTPSGARLLDDVRYQNSTALTSDTVVFRQPIKDTEVEGRLEVRPIGTSLGLRELAALHRRTWQNLNVQEKRVHMLLWPLALHFGLYQVTRGSDRKRPPLIGAFWARCLAEAPLTLGHLYPPVLFKGMNASEVFEFGGMVIDPTYQGLGLVKLMSDTARLFLFSRRPKLLITNPVEPLYEMYKQFGLKTVGKHPIPHPHINVKVWLMYGKFDVLSKPYFM